MCIVEGRRPVQHAAAELRARPGVIAVDVHPPDSGLLPQWSIEALLQDGGVPSAVLGRLAHHGLELRESRAIGPHWRFVAAVE